jgi:hypothetical protein
LKSSFPITVEMAQQVGETNPVVLAQVADCQDGWVQTWIRARFLFSRLEHLRGEPEFQRLLSRQDNIRSLDFLDEEQRLLADRVAQKLKAKHGAPDQALRKKIENFRHATSVFLASLLRQACESEAAIQQKLAQMGLLIEPPDQSSWKFTVSVLALLAVAVALVYLVWSLLDWNEYLKDESWHLTSATMVFLMTALFAIKRRERRFSDLTKERAFDAAVGSAIHCGLPIGIVAGVVTFTLHGQGLTMLGVMLLTALCLAVISSFLFEFIMRLASQSPPTRGALQRLWIATPSTDFYPWFGRSVLTVSAAAIGSFAIVFALFWAGQATISKRVPTETLDAAEAKLMKLVNSYSSNNRSEVHDRFRNISFDVLLGSVRKAKHNTSRSHVAAAVREIESACTAINTEFGDDLLKSCGPNGAVTIPLGDGVWLELLRDAMLRVETAVKELHRFEGYVTPTHAMATDWPRALAVSVLWAFLTAVFAISILLYRRSILWARIHVETLKDCAPNPATAAEWLRTPIDDLEGLTPLEAMRYQGLRASLSDYVRAGKQRPTPDLPVAA